MRAVPGRSDRSLVRDVRARRAGSRLETPRRCAHVWLRTEAAVPHADATLVPEDSRDEPVRHAVEIEGDDADSVAATRKVCLAIDADARHEPSRSSAYATRAASWSRMASMPVSMRARAPPPAPPRPTTLGLPALRDRSPAQCTSSGVTTPPCLRPDIPGAVQEDVFAPTSAPVPNGAYIL